MTASASVSTTLFYNWFVTDGFQSERLLGTGGIEIVSRSQEIPEKQA